MDDTKVKQVTDSAVFEMYAKVSVLRCDESPLDAEDREEALDLLALAVGDASTDIFTFVGSFGPIFLAGEDESDADVEKESEPDVEEVQAAIHAAAHDDDDDVPVGTEEPEVSVPLASKECMACHSLTTQLDVNQCPMCGNPFS